MDELFCKLNCNASPIDFSHLKNLTEKRNYHCMVRKSFIQFRKFKRLGYIPETTLDSDKVIFNYPNTHLSDVQKRGLSRGLKYSFCPDRLNSLHFTTFEKLHYDLKNETLYV